MTWLVPRINVRWFLEGECACTWLQVFGREREIDRVCEILARRKKNNPLLLGEPGVGKTAIAEGLALAVATGGFEHGRPLPTILRVSSHLLNARLGLSPAAVNM